jgi:hypothetical protein
MVKGVFLIGMVLSLFTVDRPNVWAGKLVTLAEDMVLPPMTPQNSCSLTELDPFPMKNFSHVTFVGKGTGRFFVYYVFSVEAAKLTVPTFSGKTYGGRCELGNLFNSPLTPTSMLVCDPPFATAAPYVAVALLNCEQFAVTVTVKVFLAK